MNQDEYLKSPELITAHYGEEYERYYGAVVPPIFMNSLNVFPTLEAKDEAGAHKLDKHTYIYGRVQNPTVRILEDKVAALEHGVVAYAFASGMAAATTAVMSTVKTGSNIVCVRNAYGPLRNFVEKYLPPRFNTTATFIEGVKLSEFEEAITDQTDLVILESPVSLVFTLQDIEGVCKIAHAHGAKVYIDNTYCTPIFSNPLDMGVDIVMHTTSKYMGGHSDIVGGVLAVKDEELGNLLQENRELYGGIIGPMEAWLVIRGLRTLPLRVKAHEQIALQVAKHLENHPKVAKVNYPGLDSHPQRELVKKQMSGTTGLLSFVIKDCTTEQVYKFADSLKIFKIGVSWGGFESLVAPCHLDPEVEGYEWAIRIHCGLEGVDDLIADLDQALANI